MASRVLKAIAVWFISVVCLVRVCLPQMTNVTDVTNVPVGGVGHDV